MCPHQPPCPSGDCHYTIRVAGRLEQRWAEWFGGLTLTHEDDGSTVLDGRVTDQAALHGLLQKIGDLGLPLLSVTSGSPVPPSPPPSPTPTTSTTSTTRSSS